MALDTLLASLHVQTCGIETSGFIDDSESETTSDSSFSSCSFSSRDSSTKTTTISSNTTNEIQDTIDSSCSLSSRDSSTKTTSISSSTTNKMQNSIDYSCTSSDSSVETTTISSVTSNTGNKQLSETLEIETYGFFDEIDNYATQTTWDYSCPCSDSSAKTTTKSSNSANAGNEQLPETRAAQEKLVDEKSSLIVNPSLNSFVGHVCKSSNRDTGSKLSYPHLGLFNGGKNIWCNCVDNSLLSWEDASDLANNWRSLADYYPPGEIDYLSKQFNESDKGSNHSFLSYDSFKTLEKNGNDNQRPNQLYSPASRKKNIPEYGVQTLVNKAYGTFGQEGSCSRAPSPPSDLVNNLYENNSVSGDFMYLLYNRFNPKMSDMLAMSSDNLLYLMTGPKGCSLVKELILFCTQSQLKFIVNKISMNSERLINVACNEKGARSLQEIIKKLKSLNLAMPMTQALSSGCYVMMINDSGRRVIQQCFNYLECNENEPLYEEVIHCCVELSTHKVGCLSLNTCIDTIKGSQRDRLLDVISDQTVCLSFCPYGTFVIQHVLQLRNPKFGDKICNLLVGNYTSLSQVYLGSHLVEKCLQYSKLGLVYLMDEIKTRPGMLEILAKHEFGNYVIQQALIISQGTNTSYYGYLIRNILPLLPNLENIKYGKRLANLIRDHVKYRI